MGTHQKCLTEALLINHKLHFLTLRGAGGGGLGEARVYLTSLGRPTDIGLQFGKACYPCSR